MTKRMLIDATHAEETRVVVLDGNRLEDFDVETAAKKQLKGNIYLAKVVRVEPSLQAAFVEYGGGRHGFLAFGEIHPDYYQIPVADRQRLLELQEAEARAEEEAEDAAAAADEAAEQRGDPSGDHAPLGLHNEGAIPGHAEAEHGEPIAQNDSDAALLGAGALPGHEEPEHALAEPADPAYGNQAEIAAAIEAEPTVVPGSDTPTPETPDAPLSPRTQAATIAQDVIVAADATPETAEPQTPPQRTAPEAPNAELPLPTPIADTTPETAEAHMAPEAPGADMAPEAVEPAASDANLPDAYEADQAQADDVKASDLPSEDEPREDEPREDEPREARAPVRFMRSYKIQEVIRRRQILLIQVVKEERGSKGAALTTYISLAGRFSVLMPNSPRGGGISRKITSTADRRRLKEVTSELQIPRGMGLIVRTAGANRPKAEIKRDCEYLLELWDSIRETTMKSVAPALIHEEANLIKRAIRDNYARDVEEVLVDGEAGWRAARDFMRMLMPAHARKVVLWNDPQPLFARQAVEAQLDAMLVPTVQLKSGGYLVINQTEALVAIDVNSGRSTRERGIEETALKTNLEAADEVARQLRLRDLAGLIVIDFIDMESRRNNAAVEKRMKDALKDDRARIQLGSISSFGLMEMSRQRLRPSLAETSFAPCPHCGGTGHVRSTETSALAVLRAIEDEGARRRAAEICVHVAGAIALYVLNHKRVRLAEIEARYGMAVAFAADESLLPPQTRIERLRAQVPGEMPEPVVAPVAVIAHAADADDELVMEEEDEADSAGAETPAPAGAETPAPAGETAAEGETRKRRRRRRGGRREDGVPGSVEPAHVETAIDPALAEQPDLPLPPMTDAEGEAARVSAAAEEEARGRRRGRRGGRRRRRDEPGGEAGAPGSELAEDGAAEEESASFDAPTRAPYSGPTPADPFGGGVFDIYDVMEQAEARAAAPLTSPPPPPVAAPARPEIEAEAAEATVPAAEPDPAAAETAQPAPLEHDALETLPSPSATPEPELGLSEIAQPVPMEHAAHETLAAPAPRPEPVAGPIRAPVLIGAADAVPEKRRGWWRR